MSMDKVAHLLGIYKLASEKGAMSLPSNPAVINMLNDLLKREMTVVNQYMVQHAIVNDWGYDILGGALKEQAIGEMKHAEAIMERIILLDGVPEVGQLGEVKVGKSVPEMLQNNAEAEREAVHLYNQAITQCMRLADNGTRKFLDPILADEELHLDDTETKLDQIQKLGLPLFLTEMTTG